MEKNSKLDGKWASAGTVVQNVFKVIIKRNKYVSFLNNFRYGKGKIIYDNDNFTLTSTHARWLIFWTPFIEEVKGKYKKINDHTIVITDIEGRYSDYNGTWARYKNIFKLMRRINEK